MEQINRVEQPFLVEGFSTTDFVNIVLNDSHITIKVPFPIDLALFLSANSDVSFYDVLEVNRKGYSPYDLISYLEDLVREFWDFDDDCEDSDIEKHFEYGIGGGYFDWDDIETAFWDCGEFQSFLLIGMLLNSKIILEGAADALSFNPSY